MSPEELLAQIRALLDEYLAMGEGTPVAAEAQALAAAIDGATGGGPEAQAGGPPPMGDQMPMMGGEQPVPDLAGMMPEGGMPQGASFRDASMMAEEDMKKRMKTKGY